jgi:hypothetical protein
MSGNAPLGLSGGAMRNLAATRETGSLVQGTGAGRAVALRELRS